jgi:hypothetical protein
VDVKEAEDGQRHSSKLQVDEGREHKWGVGPEYEANRGMQ